MSLPTITVRIGLASDPLDNPQTWTDVSVDTTAIHIQRGRQHALDRIEAGIATVILKNFSNQYYPASSANIKPGKCINIRATYGGTTYDLFTGFIESWQPSWLSGAGLRPIMTLQCADLIKNLARFEITSAGYSQQLSGTRIGNVLTSFGYVATTDLDAGQSNIITTGALASKNAMEHIFEVTEAERGIFFIAGNGYPTFHDRHARMKSPFNSSSATFGDDLGENKYQILEPSYDDEFIYNDISLTRSGGTAQTATDATSKGDYGTRSLSKIGLLLTVDTEALSQAQFLLSQYKNPAFRIKAITLYPQADEVNLYPKVLNYDLSTRITLRLNQASLDTDYHIEGISHDCDAREGTWITRWQLSDADIAQYWAIGITGLSEIGLTTRVCY